MKKTYEKPRLMALSLSGNDQLCGTCADNNGLLLKDHPEQAMAMMKFYSFGNMADGADRGDFAGVFGPESQCSSRQIDDYCKFTSSGTLVAWS